MKGQDDAHLQVISYLGLRRAIGILGISFPVILAVPCALLGDGDILQESISHYYHSAVRDLFVGILFTIGWFLFSYKGYERKDDLAGDLAWVCALGVALCPTGSEVASIRTLHFTSATLLFLVLAYFSLCLFTKSGKTKTPRKKVRNRVYVVCGVLMLLCIALLGVYFAFLRDTAISRLKPVFWLETLALWAFGFSWIVKGEVLWQDLGD